MRDFDLAADVLDLTEWGTTGRADLTFIGHSSGSLIVQDGGELILVRNLTLANVAALDAERFIFASSGSSLF